MASREVGDASWLIAFSVLVKAWILSAGILLWDTPYVQNIVWDITTWFDFWEACADGAVPYVDITKEYAVGAGLLYWGMTPLMSLANGDGKVILLLHGILASLVDIVNVVILYCILREINARLAFPLATFFMLLPTGLVLSPERFETYVTLTVLLGYWCHRHGRPGAAAFFWSIGCWLKWYPAFFIAVQEIRALVVEKRRWQWVKVTGIFLGISLALNLPFILANLAIYGNIDNWLYPYRFHSNRAVAGDTILGLATMWFGELSVSDYSGLWTLGLVCAALVVKPRLRFEYRCLLICIAMLALNRIYSTQFNIWLYPFAILGAAYEGRERRLLLLSLLLGMDLVNVLVYPVLNVLIWGELKSTGPLSAATNAGIWTIIWSAAVVLRGTILIAMGVFVLRESSREEEVSTVKTAPEEHQTQSNVNPIESA
jgi:hypothetical protein